MRRDGCKTRTPPPAHPFRFLQCQRSMGRTNMLPGKRWRPRGAAPVLYAPLWAHATRYKTGRAKRYSNCLPRPKQCMRRDWLPFPRAGSW
jgi:hypothetical protein